MTPSMLTCLLLATTSDAIPRSYVKEFCTTKSGYCHSVNLNTSYCEETSTTVNICDIKYIDPSYYIDFQINNSIPCYQPTLTFEYEQIDVLDSSEYLSIYNNYGLIKQCQGNGLSDTQCGVWWACLSEHPLGTEINSVYTIRVYISSESDAFCDRRAINANVTIKCNQDQTPCPTFRMYTIQ